MENDSIRASGNDTLVDIWVNGKLRAICLTKEAIESFQGVRDAAGLSEEARCEFVRTHLPLVVTAVKARLRELARDPDSVTIDAGQLGARPAERRKGDRRKLKLPKDSLPRGERRRGPRRKTDQQPSGS
jgi:hypothetical protein